MARCQVYFGGPGYAPGRLRDLLAERVSAVPAGGAIDWVTYYFRDRRLAEALLHARRRGVAVRVTVDGHPRTPRASEAVIRMLSGPEGLGRGLRVVTGLLDGRPGGKLWRPRLHEKLYCFSHPEPVALVGSFNPSGDAPELEPEVLREIGDHDRGYNALVELARPAAVQGLLAHARRMHGGPHGPFARFAPASNRAIEAGDLTIHFWPRILRSPVFALLERIERGGRVRIAASHVSGRSSLRALLGLAERGVALEMLTEETARRVPHDVEQQLASAGVSIRRVAHPEGLPMHDKFALIDAPGRRVAIFGSFNWSQPSQRTNREIGVISRDPKLFDLFAERWDALSASG